MLKVREERRLRVFENRVLRRIFGPKRDEVTWEWRKLHEEELNDLYSSPNFFITKPTRCTNFTNLLRHKTLHVSDSSSAHHQEFNHCTLGTGICHTGL